MILQPKHPSIHLNVVNARKGTIVENIVIDPNPIDLRIKVGRILIDRNRNSVGVPEKVKSSNAKRLRV
jgi:hypothetical protein